MNASKVLVAISLIFVIMLLAALAASSAITAYNSFSNKQNIVVVDHSPAKRHSCGCVEGKCNCCNSCICKQQHVHEEAEKPSGKVSPLGAKE